MLRRESYGFTLVELLLVVAIIGIISTVAIPSLLNQRARAKAIGDAQANAKSLAMILESRKAETGVYGASGTIANWTPTPDANATALAPQFSPSGNSRMTYKLTLLTALTYELEVKDPTNGNAPIYKTNQTGAKL